MARVLGVWTEFTPDLTRSGILVFEDKMDRNRS